MSWTQGEGAAPGGRERRRGQGSQEEPLECPAGEAGGWKRLALRWNSLSAQCPLDTAAEPPLHQPSP